MAGSDRSRIYKLTAEANSLPHGEVQVRLLDEAVKLADVGRDLELMFETRLQLIESATFSGHSEKAMLAFGWCLAQFEKESERFEDYEETLLWFFKNILHNADEFPQLSRDQVEQLRDQMASHYRRCGFNMRPVHHTQLVYAMWVGDRQLAAESHKGFSSIPRDEMADCVACETNTAAEYHAWIDEPERAIEVAKPILLGRQRCAEVPHTTYSHMLRPFAQLDRYEEGDEFQKKGYRLIRNNRDFLNLVALHMAYLLHREREKEALRLFERHLPWGLETHQLRSRYLFYLAANLTLRRVAEAKGTQKLNLPSSFAHHDPSGQYELSTLIEWFENELSDLGARFDSRNGNTYFTGELPRRLAY